MQKFSVDNSDKIRNQKNSDRTFKQLYEKLQDINNWDFEAFNRLFA